MSSLLAHPRAPAHDPVVDDERLIRAATIIADADAGDLSDEELAQRLVEDGIEEPVAYRLVAFLPSAFARPVLEELGVVKFARASLSDEDGRDFEVVLEDQPEYCAALALARKHRRVGAMPHDLYKSIVGGTAEFDAASRSLDAGLDLKGGTAALALSSTSHARHVVRRKAWWRLRS